jgi:glycosyltransferase involved in cell wall biosynthesis
MRDIQPRIAFFADSFLEVNGAAMTCRQLVDYARERNLPMLCIFAGKETQTWDDGSVRMMSLKRSGVAISLDEGLAFDPLFNRHINRVVDALDLFDPSVIHITGLNDVSIIGAYLAWKKSLPMIASWHTNLHEFASRRIRTFLRWAPDAISRKISGLIESLIFEGSMLYYRMPKIVLSPNTELVAEIGRKTGRDSRLMGRGVDCEVFDPRKRDLHDSKIRIGFVGRLRPEKNPRVLVDVEKQLVAAGIENYEFLIVGEGSDRVWLEENLKKAHFTGFLKGEELSTAYANMDIFVFPSETDAFGNVAQEAIASGAPAIVSAFGGPKAIIEHGKSGFVAYSVRDYGERVIELINDPKRLSIMRNAARERALSRSWSAVFDGVYDAYNDALDKKKMSGDRIHTD